MLFRLCLLFLISLSFSVHSSFQSRLLEWDAALNTYYKENKDKKTPYPFRVFLCLYSAQQSAYDYIKENQLPLDTSFDELNLKVCRYFMPDFSFEMNETDSKIPDEIQKAIVRQVALFCEQKRTTPFIYVRLKNPEEYVITSPPPLEDKAFWDHQLERLICFRRNATEKERQIALDWNLLAGAKGKNWPSLLTRSLEKSPPSDYVFIHSRALLMQALHDAFERATCLKNEFKIPRPEKHSSVFEPLYHLPDYSFPSSHASLAGCAFVILNHFFPSERNHWREEANEQVCSRLWAGVHFPIDVLEGRLLGENIGRAFLCENCLLEDPFKLPQREAISRSDVLEQGK